MKFGNLDLIYLLIQVGTFVMDNDSTTIAKVKATVSPNIEKRADRNHTKKGFAGALLELGNTHKLLKNPKLRSHIERFVSKNEKSLNK